MFMDERFKFPILLNVFIKLLVRVKLGQAIESLWFIGVLNKGMYKNLKIKLFKTNIRGIKKGSNICI